MRNPDRLDNFYDTLKKIHKYCVPDWRFTQLISNVFGDDMIPYYIEEDDVIKVFKYYFKTGNITCPFCKKTFDYGTWDLFQYSGNGLNDKEFTKYQHIQCPECEKIINVIVDINTGEIDKVQKVGEIG